MEQEIRRGFWLTAFLVAYLCVSILSLLGYLFLWNRMASMYPPAALYTLASISLLRLATFFAIWFWNRAGVVGYVLLTLVAIPVELRMGLHASIFGLGGVIILLALIWPKWKYMSWEFSLEPRPVAD